MKKLCTILFIGFASSATFAQSLLSEKDAIAAALKNNYDIQLLRNDSVSYAIDKSFINAAFYPRINATSNLVFNNNNQKQKLADGTIRQSKSVRSINFQNAINLNWVIFDGFKMFISRDKLLEIEKLGNTAIKDQIAKTIADVVKTYYNIVRQKQQLQAINEQMGLNEERLKLSQKKLGTGLGAKPEVLQSTLDLNAQKIAKLQQLSLIDQIKEQLNLLMNVPQGTLYEVSDSIPFKNEIALGDALAIAKQSNTQLNVIQQNKTIAQFTLMERRAERFPTLSINSAYNFNKTNNKTVLNNFTPLFNRNYGFNYGLSLSIPILNNYQIKRNIKQAENDIAYQELLYAYQQRQIENAISIAFKNYLLQKNVLELEEQNIRLAKENVYISSERLRLGITTVLELRETQKSLEDAYNRLIAARYNAKVAETDLLRLTGEILQ